ncbi:MAG TPA: thioredoxin family protein [Chitinophagaceae bacterium]|nr:thioredoxin family protein [Chitinophagaceae bacterium]
MTVFESHIQGSLPVVAEFYAEGSALCERSESEMLAVREQLGSRGAVVKVNVEENPGLRDQFHIETLPTIIVFHHGNILWRKNGLASAHEILEHLTFHLA